MDEHMFRWDETKWEEVTEKDKKRITELIVKKDIEKKYSKKLIAYSINTVQKPGNRFVEPIGNALTMTYLFLFSILSISGLVQFWPHQVFTDENANYVIVVSHDDSFEAISAPVGMFSLQALLKHQDIVRQYLQRLVKGRSRTAG